MVSGLLFIYQYDHNTFCNNNQYDLALSTNTNTYSNKDRKPWIERTATKAIHIDFNGLKDEFQNLKANREEAFIRARNSGLDIVMQVASFFPFASALLFEEIEPWDASPEE